MQTIFYTLIIRVLRKCIAVFVVVVVVPGMLSLFLYFLYNHFLHYTDFQIFCTRIWLIEKNILCGFYFSSSCGRGGGSTVMCAFFLRMIRSKISFYPTKIFFSFFFFFLLLLSTCIIMERALDEVDVVGWCLVWARSSSSLSYLTPHFFALWYYVSVCVWAHSKCSHFLDVWIPSHATPSPSFPLRPLT